MGLNPILTEVGVDVRLIIYKQLFQDSVLQLPLESPIDDEDGLPSIFLTCKLLRAEALPIYQKLVTSSMDLSDMTYNDGLSLVQRTPHDYLHTIRNLRVTSFWDAKFILRRMVSLKTVVISDFRFCARAAHLHGSGQALLRKFTKLLHNGDGLRGFLGDFKALPVERTGSVKLLVEVYVCYCVNSRKPRHDEVGLSAHCLMTGLISFSF